ncbi:hypothetical protein BT93_C0747 [Corymbia citriodora subsp. variegata]|nr:hypothetical protein BT93_C0747 [Corymbia citriodora subsp. variegata]
MNIIKQVISTRLEQMWIIRMLIVLLKTYCTELCPEEVTGGSKIYPLQHPSKLESRRVMACTTFGVDLNQLRQRSCLAQHHFQ